jgi:hypothetical protein
MWDKDFVEYKDGNKTRRLSVDSALPYVALCAAAGVILFCMVQAAAWFVVVLVSALAGL